MPFAGLGLHVLLALFCAFHVVRTGRQLYWLFILFAFPVLGSVVYFLMVYVPDSRLRRGARKAVTATARAIDPMKEVRLARADFEQMPTAQNQMRLASALLETGKAAEAATLYESGLQGPFASDPELRFGAARAFIESHGYAQALVHLEALRASRPEYRPDAVSLLLGRCYAGTLRPADARREFEQAIARFGTFEAHAEYAIWALETGDVATAGRLRSEIDKMTSRWNGMTRKLNEAVMLRLKAAAHGHGGMHF
ncbi:hypothetical protein WKW79_33320 [Variovorax robiniae]|uniref:Tetratricopeptide repeat protein n=1 Tax=Variovorax robiniae TaxID=1836199 RepID=A0ABU8XII2_9BURK